MLRKSVGVSSGSDRTTVVSGCVDWPCLLDCLLYIMFAEVAQTCCGAVVSAVSSTAS